MKTSNTYARILFLALSAAFAVCLGNADARAEGQAVTVQYGQGTSVTFYKPVSRGETTKATTVARSALRWSQQGIPNGPAVSFTVRDPAIEIAPVK